MTQEDQNKLSTSTPSLESNRFLSEVSRFTSSKTNSAEPSRASIWVELLEEDWHAQGYRLASITPVPITRIVFSDSMGHKWKNGAYLSLNLTNAFGIESENEGPGENCQYRNTKNSTFKGKGKGKGRKMQAKWVVGRRRNRNPFFFFFKSHLSQKTMAPNISVQP